MKLAVLTIFSILVVHFSFGQSSVVNTPHNLSAGSPSTIKAETEQQVCIFCHAPHRGGSLAPLWNRNMPGNSYTLYSSSTLNTPSAQPDGSSLLCLACHDGTIALGNIVSRTSDITMQGGITTMPTGGTNLTTDLSDDHPVSFNYLSPEPGELQDPGLLPSTIKLENNKIQCMSCHDAHKNTYTKFLVESNQNSNLCLKCHIKPGWAGSSHENSINTWNGNGLDPWRHIEAPYSTVSENACENCHDPHNAAQNTRLLKASVFEENCTDCHDGSVAAANIQADIAKPYSHSGYSYSQHDPNEPVSPSTGHVLCADCHSPHTVNTGNPLGDIQGIDANGNITSTISFEYELCFKCHSGPNAFPPAPTPRRLGSSNDLLVDFDGNNLSRHPVLTPSTGGGRALKPGWDQPGVVIQCSDCHASDNAAVSGPHGSIYPRILKANYNINDVLPRNPVLSVEFALCFQCHDVTGVETVHDTMKRGHFLSYTTCNTCHDPHGFTGGTATHNSFLINLNTNPTATGPNGDGSHDILMNLDGTGTCNFTCHAKSHEHSNTGGNY